MDDNLFTINVNIAGQSLALRIPREDESVYRDAAKFLKEKFNSYQQRHANSSYEKLLVMVAYHFAVMNEKRRHEEDIAPVVKKMEELNEELTRYFDEINAL